MKTLGLLTASLAAPLRRWNVRVVGWLVLALVVMVAGYSVIFHQLMALEGRQFSWVSSVYWVLTVMSTLGFGDITFGSDAGRLFSVVVLVTGAMYALVVLPFAVIQFVVRPWMDARESARAPAHVADDLSGHVLLTSLDVVSAALIERLDDAAVPYVLLVADGEEASRLYDRGYHVMRGQIDDPATYRAAGVERAALVATTRADTTNVNVAFTVREHGDVPIVATASAEASVDILQLAGCDRVLQLGDLLGRAMARRVLGGDHRSSTVGTFGDLCIAEASVASTELAGRRLGDLDLRRRPVANIVGVWQRGTFERAGPDTELCDQSVLILAGTREQLADYDAVHGTKLPVDAPVIIIGGGRVGRAAARALDERGVPSVIIEKRPDRIREEATYVEGDAAELAILRAAGIDDATAILITTHEDDVNVYLALYGRKLRPDVQIIARAIVDRNASTLHRAGADAVLSYAALGATALWNALGDDRRLLLTDGLAVFRVHIPDGLAGSSLADANVGAVTGCNVVAIECDGEVESNPDPTRPLPLDGHLVVIGDEAAERRFLDRFSHTVHRSSKRR